MAQRLPARAQQFRYDIPLEIWKTPVFFYTVPCKTLSLKGDN